MEWHVRVQSLLKSFWVLKIVFFHNFDSIIFSPTVWVDADGVFIPGSYDVLSCFGSSLGMWDSDSTGQKKSSRRWSNKVGWLPVRSGDLNPYK